MNNPLKQIKKLSLKLATLLMVIILLGALGSLGAQPVQAGPAARRTPTPTHTATSAPTLTVTPTPASTPGPNGTWTLVSSPNTGSLNNYLFGVSAVASNDVWAVGAYGTLGITAWQVIEHWNGAQWSLAAGPTLTTPNELLAVSASAANDVWAVGGYDSGGQGLIEHWDGSTWQVIANPNPGTLTRFFGVAALSSSNVWAVGYVFNGGPTQTLVEHWNGTQWSVIPSPNVPNVYNQLNAITAVPGSPDELWAVGTAGTATLILHWNGTQWSLVAGSNPGTNPGLSSVTAIAANDVWAVGTTGGRAGPLTLTEHWNGSSWSVITSPNPSSTQNRLLGVSAHATNNVWAVGSFINTTVGNLQTLLLRWNGTSWVRVSGDNAGPTGLGLELAAVSSIGTNDVWSVGDNSHTLAEHWNGAAWSSVSTPNAGVGQNFINGVSGSSATDVWQAGNYTFGLEKRTMLEHWNGASWSLVSSPNTSKRTNVLNGLVALSPSEAWAVGSADSGIVADQVTLVLHWDGANWNIVASPSPGTEGLNELRGVAATSTNDIWAVGSFTNNGSYAQTLVEHWNGSTWSVVPSADVPGTNNGLFGVVALSASNVWAIGYSGNGVFATLIEHWDGASWSIVSSPNPTSSSNVLRAVAATGANDIWTVGTAQNLFGGMDSGLIEHWNGNAWSVVPSVNPFPGPTDVFGVAAISAGNAWAVGTTGGLSFIERWNGSSWSLFASPNVTGSLSTVTALSACELWAAGQSYVTNIGAQTLDEHFTCN